MPDLKTETARGKQHRKQEKTFDNYTQINMQNMKNSKTFKKITSLNGIITEETALKEIHEMINKYQKVLHTFSISEMSIKTT